MLQCFQVIAQTIAEARHSGIWRYADQSDVCERRGSGNNWACGYCIHGRRAADATLEAVRRSVENCDRFTGFITHMSLAGGTGSGLGSYLTRRLRDDYPHSFIVNQVLFFNDICRKLLWFSKSAVSSELHSYIIKVSKASIVEDQIRFQYDLELLLVA